MVTFTCNDCGTSVRKNAVEKHGFKCRFNSLSCIDCNKDFTRGSYNDHNQCITENQKYGGKGYVEKPNCDKGKKKQDQWLTNIENYVAAGKAGDMEYYLNTIIGYPNVPRKYKKFENFAYNCLKVNHPDQIKRLWEAIESANKPAPCNVPAPVILDTSTGAEPKQEQPQNGQPIEKTDKKKKKKKDRRDKTKKPTSEEANVTEDQIDTTELPTDNQSPVEPEQIQKSEPVQEPDSKKDKKKKDKKRKMDDGDGQEAAVESKKEKKVAFDVPEPEVAESEPMEEDGLKVSEDGILTENGQIVPPENVPRIEMELNGSKDKKFQFKKEMMAVVKDEFDKELSLEKLQKKIYKKMKKFDGKKEPKEGIYKKVHGIVSGSKRFILDGGIVKLKHVLL